MDSDRLGIGGNNPPDSLDLIDPRAIIDPEIIAPLLERHFSELTKRRDQLADGVKNWIAAHTVQLEDGSWRVRIEDDHDLYDATDFREQLAKFTRNGGSVQAAKATVKEPLFAALKAAEVWFTDVVGGPVARGYQQITAPYEVYLREKADRERERRQQEADRARQEALRLAEEAKQAKSLLTQRVMAEEAAEAASKAALAQQEANAKLTDVSRVRGALGTIGGLKEVWRWRRGEDFMALVKAVAEGRESVDLLTTNDKVINTLIGKPAYRRSIPGLEIYREEKAR